MSEKNALVVSDKQGLQSLLESMKESISDVLPRHLTPERVIKMALVAASRTPRLYECTKASIAKALMTASELGLDCSGTLGSGYLVPYKNGKSGQYEVQFIAGYRGLIDLARRGGQIKSIRAHCVYDKDDYIEEQGLEPKLYHKRFLDGDPGKLKLVYAVAELADGSKQYESMTINEVDAIRKRSKAGSDGPWVTDYNEMARKTVVRRLCKYLPLSAELEKAMAAESELDATRNEPVAAEIVAGVSRTAQLVNRVKKAKQPQGPDISVAEAAFVLSPIAEKAGWQLERFEDAITASVSDTAAALNVSMEDLREMVERAKAADVDQEPAQ